ncbi:THAP domain-containing protein 5-like [Anomaloglossus baeobatrachus]|uniref:THAP domain-containing protein 5-like n=1 Tax=Anomaloglossus baeobatrachus TaxID=238106 RepID=UPI003F4F93C1
MPSCLVNQCLSRTGKKGQSEQITLHPFPKDITRIKLWLQQTGQVFKDLNAVALRILNENKKNRYRLCSCHFSPDSYIVNICGRTLRVDAIPSIFPIVDEGESIIEENLRKDRAKARKRPFVAPAPNTTLNIIVKEEEDDDEEDDEEILQDIQLTKIGFSNTATQTDYTLSNSILVLKDLMIWKDTLRP